MRRVTLLALLLLPTAAMAGSVNFTQHGSKCTQTIGSSSCTTGTFVSGTISDSLTAPFDVTVVGTLNTIEITLRNLTCGPTFCSFTDMAATVLHNGIVLFSLGGLVSGKLIRTTTTADITANLDVTNTVTFDGAYSGTILTWGTATVTFPKIGIAPEPSALELVELGLLGTGVIGLAQMASSKLKR